MNRLLMILFTMALVPAFSVPITWSSPTTLSSAGVVPSNQQVGMDKNGNIVAVWLENNTVVAKTKLVSGSWSTTTTLSSPSASSPALVVDPNGNATAVWIDGGVVTTATRLFGGSWGMPTPISGAGASCPKLAVDPNGNVVAVWTLGGVIQSVTKLFNGSWPAFFDKLSEIGIPSDSPNVAIGNNGNVVAVWHGAADSGDQIFAVSKPVNGTWGLVQTVSGEVNSNNPKVAVDPNGNSIAVWFAFNNANNIFSNVAVQAASLPMNGSWSTPATLTDKVGYANPSNLSLRVAYDGVGNALAVWETSFDGENYSIQSAVLPVGGTWTPPANISSGLSALSEDVAVDSNGDAFAIFMNQNSSTIYIQSADLSTGSYNPNIWSNVKTLSNTSTNAFPVIAVGLNGNQIKTSALWLSLVSSQPTLVAATGTGTVFVPPSGLTVTQSVTNHVLTKDYYNTVSWQASNDPNLVGYVIYRNGVFLQTIGKSTRTIVDHNRDPAVHDTYGVAAYGSGSEQSKIITAVAP